MTVTTRAFQVGFQKQWLRGGGAWGFSNPKSVGERGEQRRERRKERHWYPEMRRSLEAVHAALLVLIEAGVPVMSVVRHSDALRSDEASLPGRMSSEPGS